MASTNFSQGVVIPSPWLNDTNYLVYNIFNGLSAVPASGKIFRSNGTNVVASTSTFADTYSINTLLYASSANTVTGLATLANAFLTTNGSGVPAWSTAFPALSSITFNGATSGTTILQPTATASGTLTLPAATDTLVGKATTDTLTNKTLTSPKMTVQTLTPGATISVDMSLGTSMVVTLGSAANAVQNPTNLAAGMWGWITIKQDATGSRTMTWASNYKFVGGVAPVGSTTGLSTAANAVDRVYWVCDDGTTVQCTFGKGFA